MEPNKKRRLSGGILAALIPCTVLALGVLVWLLIRPGAAPAEAAAAPKPTISPSPIFVTATPAPTATPEPTPSPTPEPTATPVPTPVPVELGETEDAGQEYIDKIVFLGDSTTYWAYGYGVLPHTQVWTGYQCTLSLFNLPVEPIEYYDPATPDVAESLLIPQCAAKRQPEILVTTQGLNGINGLTEEQFKGYYIDMIHAIQEASPDTKIICQSAFPVNDRESRNVSNEDINTANQWIYEIAEETGVRYLNSHDLLMDENGQLRDEYNNHDGLGFHINGDGWRAVLMNVRTHAWL